LGRFALASHVAPARARFAAAIGWALGGLVLSLGMGVLLATHAVVPLDIGLAVAVAVAVSLRPYPALLAVLAIHVVSPGEVFWTGLTLVGVGLAVLVRAPGAGPRRVVLPLLLLLLITLPGVPLHPSPDEGVVPAILTIPGTHVRYSDVTSIEMAQWLGVGAVFATIGLAAWAVTTRARLSLLVTAVICGSLYPIGYALEQYAAGDLTVRTGQSDSFAAVRGPFEHPNYLAFYLLVVLGIALVAIFEVRTVALRIGLGAFIAAASMALLLTYTRSAWIGAAIVVLILGILRYRSLLVVGVIALGLAAFAFPTAARKVQDRFGDLSSSSQSHASNSWNWRTGQWDRMEHWGWEKPVLGQGFGSYPRISVKEFGYLNPHYGVRDRNHPGRPQGIAAHNDYVKMFVETGIVGLVLWVLTLAGLASTAGRARRAPPLAAYAAGMVAVAVALALVSIADNVQGYTTVLLVAGAMVGALAGVQRAEERAAAT
jgi:O-antigen ligase